MKNTFLNKVTAERSVLKIVNRYRFSNQQLTGLSKRAIDTWLGSIELGIANTVRAPLEALSMQCQRLSDRSHETFSEIEEVNGRNLNANLANLEGQLSRLQDIAADQ